MAFCDLSQEKLDQKGWVNNQQKCTAKCAGGIECTKYYSEHPTGKFCFAQNKLLNYTHMYSTY
jgi:hypothetical protein